MRRQRARTAWRRPRGDDDGACAQLSVELERESRLARLREEPQIRPTTLTRRRHDTRGAFLGLALLTVWPCTTSTGPRVGVPLGDPITVRTPEDPLGVEFAIGDRLLITRNQPALGLTNGTRGTLTTIDSQTIRLRTDDGLEHTLPRQLLADGQLQHGYALTIHKAQGQTVDIALVHACGGLSAEAGYVALSRARHATHIYAGRPADLADAPGRGRAHARVYDLAEQLQQRRAQSLASEQYAQLYRHSQPVDRARGIGR